MYAKYLPRGVTLNNPRSMRREEMIKLFQHIGNRQTSHGVTDAFRFKAVLSSRKLGNLNQVKYDEPVPVIIPGISFDPANDALPMPNPATITTPNHINPSDINTPASGTVPLSEIPPASWTSIFQIDPPEGLQSPALITGPVPAPERRPRPKPRMKGKKKATSESGSSGNIIGEEIPTQPLTLDPSFEWEVPIQLDPLLDPAFDIRENVNNSQTPTSWDNPPIPAHSYTDESIFPPTEGILEHITDPAQYLTLPNMPISDQPVAGTSRRKGKNADLLAREEAEILTGKRRSRH